MGRRLAPVPPVSDGWQVALSVPSTVSRHSQMVQEPTPWAGPTHRPVASAPAPPVSDGWRLALTGPTRRVNATPFLKV